MKTTAHGEFAVVTNRGRLIRCRSIELPTVPLTAVAPRACRAAAQRTSCGRWQPGERPLGLTTLGG